MKAQKDNNLVVYSGCGSPTWSSNTSKKGAQGKSTLKMQNNGNLVLFDVKGKAIWSSNTSFK